MGLTIHYGQKEGAASITKRQAEAAVDFVKEVAERSKWPILAQWDEFIEQSEYEAHDENYQPVELSPGKVHQIGISVHPHKDCESVVISFYEALPGEYLMGHFYKYPSGEGSAQTMHFTKTHYAGFATHRKVCRLLEAIDKHFMALDVSDEGDYYGIWDDEKGAKTFGEYVNFVHGMGNMIKGHLGADSDKLISSEDETDGWKDDYVDHLARKYAEEDRRDG